MIQVYHKGNEHGIVSAKTSLIRGRLEELFRALFKEKRPELNLEDVCAEIDELLKYHGKE